MEESVCIPSPPWHQNPTVLFLHPCSEATKLLGKNQNWTDWLHNTFMISSFSWPFSLLFCSVPLLISHSSCFNPLLHSSYRPTPLPLSCTHLIWSRLPISLRFFFFQSSIPSALLYSTPVFSLFSHPFLLPPSLGRRGVFFLPPFQVLWSGIVLFKGGSGPKEGGRPLPSLKPIDIDPQQHKHWSWK